MHYKKQKWPRHDELFFDTASDSSMSLKLSVLDQSVAMSGRGQDESIRQSLALAIKAERMGYSRFWVSEHHAHPSIVGTAPEILMAAIATQTSTIRIGSAGVMLPHYAALKVAEQFRVLDALAQYSWVCVKKTDALRTSNSRAVNTFSPLYDRGHPQMVPLAVVDLITSGAKPYVIGSDFFASPVAYRPSDVRLVGGLDGKRQSDTGSNGGSFDRTSLMASHNIVENWSLTKNLFEAGLVSGDSGFEEVMTHSLSELMDIYDAHLGISRI